MSKNKRLEELERKINIPKHTGYISVKSLEELDKLEIPAGCKVYIGISPDDWRGEDEHESENREA